MRKHQLLPLTNFLDFMDRGLLGSYPEFNFNFSPWHLDDQTYSLEVDLPGVSKEDIKVHLNKNVLEIRAKKQTKNLQGVYNRQYNQTVTLPEDADPSNVNLKFENGVLAISVNKTKGPDLKSLEIK